MQHFNRRDGFGAHTSFEGLEPRLVLSAISWDGGPTGEGTDWHDPANWAGDVLPADGDDVTIDVAADPLILYSSGTLSLNSLTTTEDVRVTGGDLGVTGVADIDATLSLQGGTIRGGSWDVTGGVLQPLASSNNRIVDAAITGDLTIDQSNGRVRVEGSTSWTGAARLSANSTALGFEGGTVLPGDVVVEGGATGTRAITMYSAGSLTIPAGRSVSSDAGFNGSVQIGGSFHWSGAMDLVNEGSIDVTSGTASRVFEIQSESTLNNGTIAGGVLTVRLFNALTNNGTLRAENGGTVRVEIDGGVFVNDGTLEAGPGGTVEVADDLILAATSVVRLEINGFVAGDIGFLQVGGVLTMAGTMHVAGVDGWAPECVLLDCVHADSLAGAFDTLDLPVPPAGHQSFLNFKADGQTIRFAISPESDWNQDGVLDTLDFLVFLNDWVADDPRADFNGDGRIDTLDFLAFLNSWTNGCG